MNNGTFKAIMDTLNAVADLLENVDDDCGETHCPDCESWRPLRKALMGLQEQVKNEATN